MNIDEAMKVSCMLTSDRKIPLRPRTAISIVLQELGALRRHYRAERPYIIHGRDACKECETELDKEKNPFVCPTCGKRIDWSDPK